MEEARRGAAAGADVVIAQGVEAGGDLRGTLGSLALLPQVVRAVRLPVVASGGFASGGGLLAALAPGAAGIHCGTAFLATRESYAHDHHKRRVRAAGSEDTVHTDAFAINWPPGSPVRVLGSALTEALGERRFGHHPDAIPREVVAREGDRSLYRYSTDSPLRDHTGDLEQPALFAGQAVGLIDDLPAASERLRRIVEQARGVDRPAVVRSAGDGVSTASWRAWRLARRHALLAARRAMGAAHRAALDARLLALPRGALATPSGRTLGLYWPVRGEPDLLALAELPEVTVALPVVRVREGVVEFHAWRPGEALRDTGFGARVPARRRPVNCASTTPAVTRPGVGGAARHARTGKGDPRNPAPRGVRRRPRRAFARDGA